MKIVDNAFWLDRWRADQIAFHQGRANAALGRHFAEVAQGADSRVLVPLCGKAVDMAWLRERGCDVRGVELSPVAVADFFREQGLAHEERDAGAFRVLAGERVTLLCGDFFELDPRLAGDPGWVYDRAALIALPPELRERYAAHLLSVIPPAARILLLTLEYPAGDFDGPPFSVAEKEVRALYARHREVRTLSSRDILAEEPGLAARGASALVERAYLVGAEPRAAR